MVHIYIYIYIYVSSPLTPYHKPTGNLTAVDTYIIDYEVYHYLDNKIIVYIDMS